MTSREGMPYSHSTITISTGNHKHIAILISSLSPSYSLSIQHINLNFLFLFNLIDLLLSSCGQQIIGCTLTSRPPIFTSSAGPHNRCAPTFNHRILGQGNLPYFIRFHTIKVRCLPSLLLESACTQQSLFPVNTSTPSSAFLFSVDLSVSFKIFAQLLHSDVFFLILTYPLCQSTVSVCYKGECYQELKQKVKKLVEKDTAEKIVGKGLAKV